ncbi:MAG TPA: hypothetical protein VFV86_13290 [Nitrososphaeraceae archaeon]|nr:hypothetical protein [Nitrososphaeraceae archaeon]
MSKQANEQAKKEGVTRNIEFYIAVSANNESIDNDYVLVTFLIVFIWYE